MIDIKHDVVNRVNGFLYDREMVLDIVNNKGYSYRELFSLAYKMAAEIFKDDEEEMIVVLDNGL